MLKKLLPVFVLAALILPGTAGKALAEGEPGSECYRPFAYAHGWDVQEGWYKRFENGKCDYKGQPRKGYTPFIYYLVSGGPLPFIPDFSKVKAGDAVDPTVCTLYKKYGRLEELPEIVQGKCSELQ